MKKIEFFFLHFIITMALTREILNSHPVGTLKKEVAKTNIKGYSKMKKAELVELMMKNKERFGHIQKAEGKKVVLKPPKELKKSIKPDKPKEDKPKRTKEERDKRIAEIAKKQEERKAKKVESKPKSGGILNFDDIKEGQYVYLNLYGYEYTNAPKGSGYDIVVPYMKGFNEMKPSSTPVRVFQKSVGDGKGDGDIILKIHSKIDKGQKLVLSDEITKALRKGDGGESLSMITGKGDNKYTISFDDLKQGLFKKAYRTLNGKNTILGKQIKRVRDVFIINEVGMDKPMNIEGFLTTEPILNVFIETTSIYNIDYEMRYVVKKAVDNIPNLQFEDIGEQEVKKKSIPQLQKK